MINAVAAAFMPKSRRWSSSPADRGLGESRSGLLLHHQAKTLDSQFASSRRSPATRCGSTTPRAPPADIARARQLRAQFTASVSRSRATWSPAHAPGCAGAARGRCRCARGLRGRDPRTPPGGPLPVLMAGVEVRRFGLEDKVAELSRRLGIPVVTSFMGRGLLADRDARRWAPTWGSPACPEVSALVEDSDGLFLVGVIISDTNFAVSASTSTCATPSRRSKARGHDGLPHLCRHPARRPGRRASRRSASRRRTSAWTAPPSAWAAGGRSDDRAADIACAVNDLMAAHGKLPIASDMGDCLFTAMDIATPRWSRPATTRPWASACPPASACRRPPGSGR